MAYNVLQYSPEILSHTDTIKLMGFEQLGHVIESPFWSHSRGNTAFPPTLGVYASTSSWAATSLPGLHIEHIMNDRLCVCGYWRRLSMKL